MNSLELIEKQASKWRNKSEKEKQEFMKKADERFKKDLKEAFHNIARTDIKIIKGGVK